MTRTTNARLAGYTDLVYLAAGIGSLALAGRTQLTGVLDVFASFSALVLGVTLYALTRDEDHDLAMLGLVCRVIEAVPGRGEIYFAVGNAIFCWLLLRGRMIPVALARLGLLGSIALAAILLLQRGGLFSGATSWASSATWLVWLPMLVFELWFAWWLIVRGVAAPAREGARMQHLGA
jgi:Domain of unknown function (DUF4386)